MLIPLGVGGLIVIVLVNSAFAVYLYESYRQASQEWHKPRADFQVQIIDRDNIPVRHGKLTARAAAELIRHLDNGWYK